MRNLLDDILEKNAKKHEISTDLIKKILELQVEYFGTDSKIRLQRRDMLVAMLKENLK